MNHSLIGLAVLVLFAAGAVSYAHAQTVSVYVQAMPRHWQDQFGSVLPDAMIYWEKSVPGLKFETTTRMDDADFVVEWTSQNQKAKLGYYSSSDLNDYGKPILAVTLGFFDDGKWQLIPAETALQVTKHELGHAIAMPHSDNPENVMYHTVDDFESLQYLIQFSDSPKDAHASSTKYQELANEKILPLEEKIAAAKSSLGVIPYGNKASDPILDDAWMAYWWAVKYLDLAEKAQTRGGAFVLQSDYTKSYYEFRTAYEYAEDASEKLAQIDEHIAKINNLK